MKQTILSTLKSSKGTWAGGLIFAAIVFHGLIANSETVAVQSSTRAVDSMYTCINKYSAAADRVSTNRGEIQLRSKLRAQTKEGIDARKKHLKKFNDIAMQKQYQKLDTFIKSGNTTLAKYKAKNRVIKPRHHLENIKAERDNILAQLNEKANMLNNPNVTTKQLAINQCEMSWGLRALAVAGRKWRAQFNTDALNTRNAVAKAYWIAAGKPKGKDPAQFDKTIANFQSKLDGLIIPRTGVVGASTLNPRNGDSKNAFKNHISSPQRIVRQKVVANSQQLKQAAKPVAKLVKNKYGYVQLPISPNNELYYIYGARGVRAGDGGSTPSYQRYGKPVVVKTFQNVAAQFHKRFPEAKLVAGDLNAIEGHASHKNGLDIDVYAQNHLATDMRGKYRNPKSVQRSISLGKMFMDTRKIDVIFYNDSKVINSVNAYAKRNNLPGRMAPSNSTHEFHFHVRFKGKSGPYDNCARASAPRSCFNH